MNKIEEIFRSWNIAFNPDDKQAELASKRIEICNSCEYKVSNLGINRCSVCGCALKGKVFSPIQGACPKGKWDQVDGCDTDNLLSLENLAKVVEELENVAIMPTPIPDTIGKIFVQIASYRDPELLPTIDDLFSKADHPENLVVCIAWQHAEEDEWDNLDKYKNDPRVKIIDIPYKTSKGACWARNLIQQQYNNEEYTLQLDSHHRFIEGWDTELINMYQGLKAQGVKLPLLTGYIPSFDPENDPQARVQEPWWMTFDRFTPEGVVFFLPATIPGWQELTQPVPARFYSAHFAFTSGGFCREVAHNPEYYFHGEEITIAVRAFTHGYDLYHPHKVVAWHEYTRKGRTKHWDDANDWVESNLHTHKLTRQLLNVDGEGSEKIQKGDYGLGIYRSLEDYERYAGIRFRDRGIQRHTLDNKFAPNPPVDNYDESFHRIFKHCIDVYIDSVPENDYEFWVVAFHDENGDDIYRKDCDKAEVTRLINASKTNDGWINIWREYTGPKPSKWIVWPYSTSKGWCNKLEGNL